MPHHSLPPITGFVDAHVHIRDVLGFGCAAAAGITVLRDAGNRENAHRGIPFDAVAHHGLRVVSSGWALFKKGGYGSAFGIPVEGRNDFHDEISRLKAAGAGIIKVMASGMVSLKKRETITPGGFDKDELAALVQEARNQGLEVMAHANGEQAIINSAEAGVRSLEHGFFMTARALDALAKRGASWTPTVGALARAADSGDVSKEMKTAVKELIRSHLAMIRRAHAGGVSLAVGTDCVLPDPGYREAYQAELAYFEEAGLAHDAVRKIAVESGAKLLGI